MNLFSLRLCRSKSDVELTNLSHTLVGTDEGVGLSFEQKKRLSIAVELAASPSIIFLDEVGSAFAFDLVV